jgi:hypothetical protein
MRKTYDFSHAKSNPYAKRLKRSVTIRLDGRTIGHFRSLSEEIEVPYQTLISLYLRDCAETGRNTMAKHRVTDGEILAQIPAARARESGARQWEPRATVAVYDAATGRVAVDLTNGVRVAIPIACIPELRGASPDDVAAVEVSPLGEGLHWERLGADYSVPDLVLILLGSTAWRSALGRAGDRVAVRASGGRREGMGERWPSTQETSAVIALSAMLAPRPSAGQRAVATSFKEGAA